MRSAVRLGTKRDLLAHMLVLTRKPVNNILECHLFAILEDQLDVL